MDDSDITHVPQAGKGDAAYTVAKAVISAVPLVGGPAAELLSAIITPPLTRRRDEWVESIAQGLVELQERVEGFNLDDLSENDKFVTTVMHATHIAVRTHQQEKLEALRNAVLNSALPTSPDEDLQTMFLTYIDELTPWHLRILKFVDRPGSELIEFKLKKGEGFEGHKSVQITDKFPELNGREELAKQIARDLYTRGLQINERFEVFVMARGAPPRIYDLIAPMGREFLKFITSPLPGEST